MTHEDKVRRIAAMVRAASRAGIPVKFRRRSVPHFVPNPFREGDDRPTIDISDLTEVLRIDPGSRLCVAESGVPFTDLVAATLSHGLIPCTVPELKTITVGGAVSGCSVESMSYKLGGFHDSCLEYEVITGTGEILTCSPDHDRDAFEMIHGSYGTVALLTKLTFRLLPAKPFVRMEYRRCSTFDRFWAEVCARCERDDFDFVDGIVHSPSQLVVCLGRMVDEAPYLSSYDWLEVYYKSTLARQEDYLRLPDYFFRYDTECHWLSRSVPVLHLEHKAVRFLLGKLLLGSTNLIRWHDRLRRLMRLKRRPEVIVDVFIPVPRFPAFWQWYEKELAHFPLWIVPYRAAAPYPFVSDEHAARMGGSFLIDAAIYGKPNSDPGKDWSEVLEKKVLEFDGVKTLISRNHYDEQTFWQIYSRPRYDAVKRRLDPHNLFGGLYEKLGPRKTARTKEKT